MINCTLSNKQLRILRTKIAKDLLTYVDNKDNFDLKDYLSKIYNQVNTATQNQNLALDYARVSVPFIKQLLGVDTSLENLPEQGLDLAGLYKLARLAGDEKKGFDNVVEFLDVAVNPGKNLSEVKNDLEKEEQQDDAQKKNVVRNPNTTIYKETRKPFDPVSTSMQEMLVDENGSPRDPRMKIYSTVTKAVLDRIAAEGEEAFKGIEYPGVNGGIFIKMMRYNKIPVANTYPRVREVIESGVDQDYIIEDYNNAFVYVLTDKDGNELKFNDKAEVTKDGTLVYYNTRFLPKRGADKLFDVDNVVNTQTAQEVAKNLNISIDEARAFLRSGFEQLEKAYKYIKMKDGNSIMYSIIGGSYGAIVDKNPSMVPFSTRIFKNEPINFAFYGKDKLKPGAFSGVYVTPALSKYPVLVAPNNITEELAENLAGMLHFSVKKSNGDIISNAEKIKILSTYILNSVKDIQYSLDKSTGIISIKLEGEPIKLSEPEAVETLKKAFLKSPSGFNRQVPISLTLANGNKDVTVFSKNPNGSFNVESVPYITYLEQNARMNVELDEDGQLKRYNPYFSLITDLDNIDKELLDPENVEEQQEETNEQKVAKLRAQEQIEIRKAIPNRYDYPDTYGEKQGSMPDNLYAIYKAIYDKYDIIISRLLGTKPKDARSEIERITDEFNPETDFVDPVDNWGIWTADADGEFITPEVYVIIDGVDYDIKDLLNQKDQERTELKLIIKELNRVQKLLDAEIASLVETKTPTDTKALGLTDPKNVFKVSPIKGRPDNKAVAKSKIATKFIGFAEGIAGSSTGSYAEQAGENANTGSYSPTDVVFVSVPGKRGSEKLQKENQDKTIAEAIKAVEAGATILTDNKAYTDSSSYNTGEKRLYEAMEKAGYNYSEVTVDDQVIGTWTKGVAKTETTTGVRPNIELSREWANDLKTRPVYTPEGINVMRTEVADSTEHFGNPWSEGGYKGTIKVGSVAEAAQRYKDWLLLGKYPAVGPERRQWILDQINEGKLDGANLLYSAKLTARGQGSHAESLADVVETLRGGKETTPVEQKAAEVVQKVEEQQIFRRGRSSADSNVLDQLMNDDDFIDKNGKNKLGVQGNIKATREQIALALKWYENSPLRQHIPFKVMFNAINTANKNGIARWDVNGITLFKGSDYSDLYHEAWHGFTQTFLTKEERDKLYDETRKNKGSFVAFSGKTVTFEQATEEELEEYLAEDFREYMLGKGNKVLDKTPVKKSIFQKIFEFLKALFGKTSADDVITNGNNNSYTNELYEKLRVGDLNQFTFNQANRVFTTLNKVVTTTTPQDKAGRSKLGYEDSLLIGSTVDSLFSEAIDKLNGNKTKVFTTAAIRTVKGRSTVYKYVLQELTKQLENVYLDKADMEAKGLDTQAIEYELDTLAYAVKHFGDPNNLSNPTGVIKYHMETSKFMEFEDRQIAELNEVDDSKLAMKNEFQAKSGNESSAKSIASPILLYTIRSLHAFKDGEVKLNKLGFPMLMDYNAAWNRIYNITDGARNIQDVYDRLSEAAADYPAIGQFLSKVGPPSNMETSSQDLWTEITHVLTMKRIPLMALRTMHSTQKVDRIDPETGEQVYENGKPVKDIVQTLKITPTRAGGEYSKVGAKWDNFFAVAPAGKYITVGADNVNTLNLAAIAENFKTKLSLNNLDRVFEFMEAVGMPLENNATVRKALSNTNNPTFKAIYDLYTTIMFGIVKYNNLYAGANPIVIKKPSELFKEYQVRVDDFSLANKLSGISIKYNTIQNFQLTWSDDFSDTTVSNAEGENQYEKSLRGTLMNQVDSINAADTITELTQEGVDNAVDLSMNHLAKSRNPFMKSSKFMKRLFDKNGKKIVYQSQYGDVVRSQIELLNMSGTSVEITNVRGIITESGIASANADETTKILQDFYMLMLYGVSEATRHADKSTTYLYRLLTTDKATNPDNAKGTVLKHLIDIKSFTQRSNSDAPSAGKIEFTKDLLLHLCAEYERIQKLKDGDPAGLATVGDTTYAEMGSDFVIFDKILDDTTKAKIKKARNASLAQPVVTAEDLYKYLSDPKRVDLKNSIEQQIGNYLASQVKEFEESLTDMGFYSNPMLADQVLTKMGVNSPQNLTAERRDQLVKDMAEAYVANSWLQHLETTLLFYGDPALFKDEADFFKRNAGLGATGGIPRTDVYMQEYINAKLASNSLASKLPGGFKPKKFGKTMTSAVMEDPKTQSVYFDEYLKEAIEFETDRLTKLKASKEQIEQTVKAITKRFGEYKKMTEGDGQGWINFDAYRALLMSLNKWSSVQESIYNKIVNGEEVTEDVLKFFPVKKMQYWGPLKTDGLPIMGFHKFSLMPLIPNIVKGKNLEKLQTKMLEQGIDYALLKSGSKINTLTKDGKVDKFYNESKSNKNKTLAIEAEGFEFTPNEIFMDYFKDQLEVHDHFSEKVTFSTQLRKLIEDGLMENGVPTDWKPFDFKSAYDRIQAWDAASKEEKMSSKNYKKLIRYEANLNALVELKKDKLKKEIGSDMKSLLDFVKKELTRQDLSDHEIDFIDYDGITKEPKQSLDLSLSADKIEKLLVAVIQKRLINQKINGESLVQVSGVGFEDANNDMRNATEEEIQKYGTNGLTFYRKKADGSTAAMKIKIALQGGFKKLLYHPDVSALANKTGLTPIQALNRLIKDENWLDKPINPNQEIYAKAFAKLDSAKGDTKVFVLSSELTPELRAQLTPNTKDGERVKGGEYHGIKILGDYYTHDTVKSKDGSNLDIIVVDKVEDAEAQYQAYLAGGAKNFTGISEIEPVDKNRSFVTLVAARIPVQGLNSMEFMEVFEFLPEEAGNIVILPAEIVAKSGGDFDIDKMFTMMPNISAKYKKISDKSIQAISDQFGREVTREEIEELEEKYADIDNEEPFTDEEVMILDLVDTLSEEEITVKLDKSRKSVKGIENALIKDSVGILSMPENRIKLITPNGIDILKGIADDMAFIDRGEAPGTKRSPTEIFELGRNLYKHQSNSIGKAVLGIIAVANTFNTLFARTGLIMSRERIITYKKDGTPVYADQDLYLRHNSIDGKISLSSAYSADLSNRVADIINQMINGAVDVAKDAWIFDIQGNKEVIPSLLFMIQAGVPIDQAIYFVSQPIIKDFLGKQRLLKSKFAVPIGQEDVGLFHRIEARNQILFNVENGFTDNPKQYLSEVVFGDTAVYDKALTWSLMQGFAPDVKNYSKEELKSNLKRKEGEPYGELDRAVFSQFIMIQEMAGQITQLTQALKFDNDKTSTLLDARMKLEQMDNLTNGISQESVRKIAEESPISAFKIQDFILEQYHRLFPLRDSQEVNEMVQNIFRRQANGKNLSSAIKKATSMDDETIQRTLRNDLMSFLFQRSYYKFDSNTKSYQGKDVEIEVEDLKNLKAAARVKEGKLYVDRNQINNLFTTKQYSKQSAWQFAAPVDSIIFDMYDSVTGKQLFTKFVFERETLRSYPENSLENISKTKEYAKYAKEYGTEKDEKYGVDKAYESVLRDRALSNLNLHGYLFYGENAYGRQIMQLKETNPELFEQYSVLANLEAVTKPYTTTTLTNLKFANTLYTADDLNIYHSNLQELANPSVIKSTDPVENERISKLFQKFGLFSVLQSGTDTRSTFSMVRAVPTEMSMALFEKPYKEFTEELSVEETQSVLRNYLNTFVTSQYIRSNYLSKKIKNWATNPGLDTLLKANGETADNVIYNLDPEALQKSIEAAAEAERETQEAEARNVMVGGIPINLTQLGISFTPNEQQIEALDNIAAFISKGFDSTSKNITDNMYTLMGYAGTGKTSITKILLEYLRKRNISSTVTATTHKAKGVLSQAIDTRATTIHKSLALAPFIDPTMVDLKKLEMSVVNDGDPITDVIIIDESSFIGPDLFKFIKDRAEKKEQQVIFIGDPAQLKPVSKQTRNGIVTEKENSPVFREVSNRSELTKVERQAGDNPLGPILDSIRNNIKAVTPTFGYKSSILGNEGIAFTSSERKFYATAAEAFASDNFKINRNFIRVVTYENKRVAEINKEIRRKLGYTEQYVVGEILMGYTNFKKDRSGAYAINNSVDYSISNVEYVPNKKVGEQALRDSGLNIEPMEMSGFNITVQDISDPKAKPVTVFMLDNNNSQEQFKELGRQSEALAALGKTNKSLLQHWYRFLESFAVNQEIVADEIDPRTGEPRVVINKTLDYGYAHTVHKSQGSTYTNIIVDMDNIDKNRDDEERNQLKYVALSRATNVAYVFTNKAEGTTPDIDFNGDFGNKMVMPTTKVYKTEEDIQSSNRVSILENPVTGIRTFKYNIDEKSGTAAKGVLTEDTAMLLRGDYPNALMIFNNFKDARGNTAGTNSVWRALGENGMGIFTKVGPSPTKIGSDSVKMAEAMTDENLDDNKRSIDEDIKRIKDKLSEPGAEKFLVFDEFGYGQYMIGYVENAPTISRPTLKGPAPQTFLYLSEQLYRNFGYINPHYLLLPQGRAVVQEGQPITDDEIIEQNKKC